MRKMRFKKFVVLFISLLVVSSLGLSQISQTGTLNGTVSDNEKQPLPGVTVSIKSPALILRQMEMITTQAGHFRFPALSPGVYAVTFKLAGFRTLVREGIRINVGMTTTVDVSLELSPIEEQITVIGQAPTVDRQSTTLVSNWTKEFLQSIPAARTLATYFNMVPGVTGTTAHGSSERDNTFNLDGVNVTDPVTGTQAGTFSIDIMEEFSVQTAGLPAEYGSVRGGVVNVVTKSGGNKFSGQASIYYRDDKVGGISLQSTNNKGTIFEGSKGGFDYEMEPGFNLGGPIIKDKIWFYVNFSMLKSQEYSPGYPWDKQPNNTPLDYLRWYPYVKITSQLSQKDKLILSYNYSDYIRHHRGAGVSQTEDTTWDQTTPIHTINIQWTRFFTSNFFTNVKVGYMDYALNLTAKNDLPNYYDSTLLLNYKSYGYDDVYERNRFQFLTDATYFVDNLAGSHEFKAGLEAESSWDIRDWRNNRDPKTGLGPFFDMRNGVPDYVIYYQDFVRKDKKFVFGGFVQDTWSPMERLTLNVGFRLDHQEGIIPKQGENREAVTYGGKLYDLRVQKSFKPIIWNTISPRIGLTFDILGDGKTVFKASFGRYFIANIMQWFVTVNPNSFISYRYRLNPDWTPKGDMYSFSATAEATMDPDLKVPYLDEFTIGIDREIIRDLRFGIRYLRKWDRNLLEGVDLNALNFDALMRGDDIFSVWTNFVPVTAIDPYDGSQVTFWKTVDTSKPVKAFYTNPPGADRDYDGLEVTLTKRFSNRWQASTSYVYAHSRGLIGTDFDDSWSGQAYYNNPNAHINAYGEFPYERKHQFKLQGSWLGPWGINISGYYRWLDGTRYTRTIRSYDLGLSLPQGNVSIYAEKRGSRKLPALSILDARLEKMFNLPSSLGQLAFFLDVFNLFNANMATNIQVISSTTVTVNKQPVAFGGLTALTDPRIIRLGFRYQF
jgi:hypothetical protein